MKKVLIFFWTHDFLESSIVPINLVAQCYPLTISEDEMKGEVGCTTLEKCPWM